MVGKQYFYLLFIFFVNTSFSQQSITSTEFLNAINDTHQIKSNTTNLSKLNKYNFNLPFVKSIEIRFETRDTIQQRKEYSLRLKPNSSRSRLANKNVYNSKIEMFALKNELIFNENLEKRYLVLVEYVFIEKAIVLHKEKQLQLQDKLHVLNQTQHNIDFDIKDVIKTESDLLATNLDLNTLKQKLINLQIDLQSFLNIQQNEDINLLIDDLIDIQQIIDNKQLTQFENTKITYQKLKIASIENEMKLDVSQASQIINYVQAKYGGRNNDLFNENFSIGIGISIPVYGTIREKKGKHLLNILTQENQLVNLTEKGEITNKETEDTFVLAKINYQSLHNQLEKSSIASLLENYKKIEGVSPLVLLKLKIMHQKIRIETLYAQKKMYESYIKSLASHAILFQKPYKNYLSKDYRLLFN